MEVFTVAALLKVLACTPGEVGTPAHPRIKGVSEVVLNQFSISGLPMTLITPVKLYGAV